MESNNTKLAFIIIKDGQTLGEAFRRIHDNEFSARKEAERLTMKEMTPFRLYKIELIATCELQQAPVKWSQAILVEDSIDDEPTH